MAIYRVSAQWTGFTGAPGYSNFHFTENPTGETGSVIRAQVHDFFSELASLLPGVVTITVDPTVEVFDESTGLLTGYETDTEDLSPVSGSGTDNFSGPAGAVINWLTATVVNGRRLRGRTFVVPLRATAYEEDGTLSSSVLGTLNDAAEVLSGPPFESTFCIWSRPQGGGTGAVGPVVGHQVPDMAAVLRSRRD